MSKLGETVWEIVNELKLAEKTELQCCGVTLYQGYQLMLLCESDRISMQIFAEKARVAVSTMTRNIEKLESAGMVRRIKSEKDGRLTLVCLTPQGRQVGEAVAASWQYYFERLALFMRKEEKEQVLAGLRILLDAMKRAGGCCEEEI